MCSIWARIELGEEKEHIWFVKSSQAFGASVVDGSVVVVVVVAVVVVVVEAVVVGSEVVAAVDSWLATS